MNRDKLLLIDGNSVLFRAFYATTNQSLTTSSGIHTNAVYGFATMLNKAIKTFQPQYIAVCFDKGKHTFRHDLDPNTRAEESRRPKNWSVSSASLGNF